MQADVFVTDSLENRERGGEGQMERSASLYHRREEEDRE